MQIASLALEALRADEIVVGQTAPRALRLIGVRAEKLARAEDGVQQTLFDSIQSGVNPRSAQTVSATASAQRGDGGAGKSFGNGVRSGSGARLVKSGRWSEVEHVMDAIHRRYSSESLKPASGVVAPEQKVEERVEQKAEQKVEQKVEEGN